MRSSIRWLSVAVVAAMAGGTAQAQLLDEEGALGTDILSSSAVRHPQLTLKNDVFDMGAILQLDRPEFDYHFTNTGNGVLMISKVQSTCGCTVPELVKKEYQPGESGAVHVKFDPSGKIGQQIKQIHILSNDPHNPSIPLTLKAVVSPVVVVEPKALNMPQVPKGQARTAIVKITGRTADFAATYATLTRGDHFIARILDTKAVEIDGKAMRQTEIEIALSPNAPVGRVTDNISIRTTDPREAVVFCPISADIIGDVKVEPSVLSFGVVRPGESFKGTVRLVSRSNKPFKVVKAGVKQPNVANVEVSATPEDPNNPTVYIISAQGVTPELAQGIRPTPIQGYLHIETDIDREGPVDVPFFVQPRLGGTGPGIPQAPAAGAPGAAPGAIAPGRPVAAPAPAPAATPK